MDEHWKQYDLPKHLTRVNGAESPCGRLYDQEDGAGPLELFAAAEKSADTAALNHIVIGPWNHGDGRARRRESWQGPVCERDVPNTFAKRSAPWFAVLLKGSRHRQFPEGVDVPSGSNEWKSYDAGRLALASAWHLLREGGRISFDAPTMRALRRLMRNFRSAIQCHSRASIRRRIKDLDGTSGTRTINASSMDASMSRHGRASRFRQTFNIRRCYGAHLRCDVRNRADWIVKLIDVYPDVLEKDAKDPLMAGYQLMVSADVLRGRFAMASKPPSP